MAPEIPQFWIASKCVACLECVNLCPDTAILAKVVPEDRLDQCIAAAPAGQREAFAGHSLVKHAKYYAPMKAKGKPGGVFNLYIDPSKCKGCAECVDVCGEKGALAMMSKADGVVEQSRTEFDFFKNLPDTPEDYMSKAPADIMLDTKSQLLCGRGRQLHGLRRGQRHSHDAGSATGKYYGRENIGVLAATGCNSVFGSSTYPYNPFPDQGVLVQQPVRKRCRGHLRHGRAAELGPEGLGKEAPGWAIGGDGAMNDIGFQALSRCCWPRAWTSRSSCGTRRSTATPAARPPRPAS